MRVRDYAAERYNRRTRALERHADAATDQARALERIAAAAEVQAIASAAMTQAPTITGNRTWRVGVASDFMNKVSDLAGRIR